MTGIAIAVGLALIIAAALKFGAGLPMRAMTAPGAALLLGLAGYAWQGSPGLAGHPVAAAETAVKFDERLAEKRRSIGERLGPASKWLILSDGLALQGDTRDAANVLTSGLRDMPNDPDLWVGLGNALLSHGNGRLSPAADYAYRRALALEPEGISPNYFYGLALAQSGQFGSAASIWAGLAQRLPADAELRGELVRNLMLLERLVQAEGGEPGQSGTPAEPTESGQ